MGQFFYFQNKMRHRLRHTHHGTCCEDVRRCRAGKMASEIFEIVLCFSVLAHNSTPLWLLELCLSIFVVSCSCQSEDSAEFRYVPLYIADQVVFRCFFYINNWFMPQLALSSYAARGKFEEHERSVRVARGVAEGNSSFLSALQTSQVLHNSIVHS